MCAAAENCSAQRGVWTRNEVTQAGDNHPCVEGSPRETGLSFVEDRAHDKSDIGGSFAEPPHEIRKPLPAERHVNADPVALGGQRRLQVAADAVQHLELESI